MFVHSPCRMIHALLTRQMRLKTTTFSTQVIVFIVTCHIFSFFSSVTALKLDSNLTVGQERKEERLLKSSRLTENIAVYLAVKY